MKRLDKKRWIMSLVVAVALVLLPSLSKSHVALADDDRNEHEHNLKYEKHKIEGKQVRESNIRKHEREDEEEEFNQDKEDREEHEGKYKADNASNANDANNSGSNAVNNSDTNNTPAPADNNSGNQPSAPTVQPNPSPSFENGQSALIQVAGQTATLNVTLSVGLEGGSEVRVNAEKVLDFMNVPYVKYNKGTLFEMYSAGHHIIFHTGKNIAFVDLQKQSLSAAPINQNGQFLIPLNVLANQLGYSLEWHADSKTFIMKIGV